MSIELSKELKLKNLESLRKKMTQTEIQSELVELGKFLQTSEAKKVGPTINTTFAIEVVNNQQIFDMEYLIPINKKLEKLPKKYKFKPLFEIKNAIYSQHIGSPSMLQETYDKLTKYSSDNKLQHITTGYNVFINEEIISSDMEKMIIDIYIGLNPNIL